jgi:carbon storage regulator
MLKLSRRIGERIMIGDDMSVRVLGVKGDQVRLGMSADKSVAIVRQEIYKKESTQSLAPSELIEPSGSIEPSETIEPTKPFAPANNGAGT